MKEPEVGWRAVRRDWAHFVRLRGERGPMAWLRVLWENPALSALWVYRYGYWAYRVCPRLWLAPQRPLYKVLNILAETVMKVSISPQAVVGNDVWLAPVGNIIIGVRARVGDGCFLHGYNTLGYMDNSDILPTVGNGVHVGPGAMLIGPITVPDNTVIGPNAVVVRTIPAAGAFAGAPAKPYAGESNRLIPTTRTAAAGRYSR